DPDAVEFLRQFGLAFVFIIFGAIHFVGYSSLWPRSRRKHSSKHKHNDQPKGDKCGLPMKILDCQDGK
ncbi:MAG: hypothetical protein ACRD72_16955, partial [Candidatus Angelobacter sp.]